MTDKFNETLHKFERRIINGHEFELRFITTNENKANREAGKYRKHGFHTRVMKMPLGVFYVYRRHKIIG